MVNETIRLIEVKYFCLGTSVGTILFQCLPSVLLTECNSFIGYRRVHNIYLGLHLVIISQTSPNYVGKNIVFVKIIYYT